MGFFDKVVKSVAGAAKDVGKAANVVGHVAGDFVNDTVDSGIDYLNSDGAAYLTPYLAAMTTEGRKNLVAAYGGYAVGLAKQYGGEQGGAIAQGVLDKIAGNDGPPEAGLGSAPEAYGFTAPIRTTSGKINWFLIGTVAAFVAVPVGIWLIVRKRKK